MKIMNELLSRLKKMSKLTHLLLHISLIYSCVLALAALIIIYCVGEPGYTTYKIYLTAKELASIPSAVMLVAVIGSVCIEDMVIKLK